MKLSRRTLFLTFSAAALRGQSGPPATPKRNMIVRSSRPEDYEMPLEGFEEWITPIERFYVRSHHYTPKVELSEWKLSISGEVAQPLTLTMADIKRFPRVELVGVMECAGNGRGLFEPPVPGVQWTYGSIGNARWAGVRLSDVLRKAGIRGAPLEVLCDGADVPVGTMPEFQRSIPFRKAMHPDTLLAYEMNGQTLPVSHGFPLRVIVPGWAGDSWTKWLARTEVRKEPFQGFFMQTAYRHPGKPVPPGMAVDPKLMKPVQNLGVKSVLAAPLDDAVLPKAPLRIAGAAWSGETPLASVQVSVDRGRTWHPGILGREQARYGWRLFHYNWTPRDTGHYVIMARAFDTLGRTQPFVQEWNPSGYLNNTVHQVAVEISDSPGPRAVPAGGSTGQMEKFKPPQSYRTACLACHQEDIIMQQRLTRVQWAADVDKMVRWGAKVNPKEREEIIEYLLRLYGPRPAN
ncbi:MAG: molybdopterin-dependent oxidoreductase [Acidobacteria bacterium]|nr:molybdopterin-dependent oxidoreductase [Acidobacteriota bacterium]